MLFFQDGTESPHTKTITYDHIHTMEKAIRTTSQLGFMLRNMDHEVCSRFVDELLLHDKNAKAIGDVNISSRDELSACIGEGNKNFSKYSVVGHIYILIKLILEEIKKAVILTNDNQVNDRFEDMVTKTMIYNRLNCFPKEISAIKLTSTARICIAKYKNDYKIGRFINLVEWRASRSDVINQRHITPQPQDFRTNIDDESAFYPSYISSMQENSERLAEHLRNVLCLIRRHRRLYRRQNVLH
jgi:hypothetical protein